MCAEEKSVKCEDDLFCGVNTVADPENMTDLEKKHVPVISAPESVKAGECFDVIVEVGKHLAHPNERGHYIHFVELYADETFLGRVDWTPVTTCPIARFCVQLDHIHDRLRAFEYCNLHGTWEGDRQLTVTE
ncbi:MAG: desulfoferrodoxin family protein [Candidatus Brocadiaceae bacterium]|jgi:superoxide reductase